MDTILTEWGNPVIKKDRPQLKPGSSWGKPLIPADIKVDDIFRTKGDRHYAPTGGTVTKAARVNIDYKTMYMDRIEMTIKIRRERLIGGYVARGKIMHEVVHESDRSN